MKLAKFVEAAQQFLHLDQASVSRAWPIIAEPELRPISTAIDSSMGHVALEAGQLPLPATESEDIHCLSLLGLPETFLPTFTS